MLLPTPKIITLQAVRILKQSGFPLDIHNNSLLNIACRLGDVATLDFLLEDDAVIITEVLQTSDLLTRAIRYGREDVVLYLLSSERKYRASQALTEAIRRENIGIVKLLLDSNYVQLSRVYMKWSKAEEMTQLLERYLQKENEHNLIRT